MADLVKQHAVSAGAVESQSLQITGQTIHALSDHVLPRSATKGRGLKEHSVSDLPAKHPASKECGVMQPTLSALAAKHSATTEGRSMHPNVSEVGAKCYATKGGGLVQTGISELAAKPPASKGGVTQPSLSGIFAKHSATKGGVTQPSLSDLAAKDFTTKGGGTVQLSLSDLAAKHSAAKGGVIQPSLSDLAAEHSVTNRGETTQPTLSLLAAKHSPIKRGEVQPSLSDLAAKHAATKGGMIQPSLSDLAAKHSVTKGMRSNPTDVPQHSAEGNMVSSDLAALHSCKGERRNLSEWQSSKDPSDRATQQSVKGVTVQHSTSEGGGLLGHIVTSQHPSSKLVQSSLSRQAAQDLDTSEGRSLSIVTAQNSATRGSGVSFYHASHHMMSSQPPSAEPSQGTASIDTLHSMHRHSNKQSCKHVDSAHTSTGISPGRELNRGQITQLPYTDLAKGYKLHTIELERDCREKFTPSPLSELVRTHAEPKQKKLGGVKSVEQPHFLQLADLARTIGSSSETQYMKGRPHQLLPPPPGFTSLLPNKINKPRDIGYVGASRLESLSGPIPLHSSHATFEIPHHLYFSTKRQPSLFSVTMCRQYCLDHNGVQQKCRKQAHRLTKNDLAHTFHSLTVFNFSSPSPDDNVKQKQTEGFIRTYN